MLNNYYKINLYQSPESILFTIEIIIANRYRFHDVDVYVITSLCAILYIYIMSHPLDEICPFHEKLSSS